MTAPLAAITGGTGFLGRYCAVALAAAGYRIRLLSRRDPAHPLLAGLAFETVPGDLADEAALTRLVHGAAVVVHAAGAVKARNAAAFLATNRDGTAHLAKVVAQHAPNSRFILISSQAARHPALSPYAASKRAGEAAMAAAIGTTDWVILRPGIVYGPWDEATASLLRLAAGMLVPVPALPEPRLSMIHATDAAAGVVAFCARGASGQTHELTDASPDGHAWRDILRHAAPGHDPRFLILPDRLFLSAGALTDAWSGLVRRPGMFGRGKAREILHRDWRPDPALRPASSVWAPRVGLADGLAETIAGRKKGWVG